MTSTKHDVAGVMVDDLDMDRAVADIMIAVRAGRPYGVSALAVHGLMTGFFDFAFRARLNSLDRVCADGQPIRWFLNARYRLGLPTRVEGPGLMLNLCRACAAEGIPVYLFGDGEETLAALESKLRAMAPDWRCAGRMPSRFRQLTVAERDAMIAEIRGTRPGIVFCGIGCPRQEVWAFENAARLGCPVVSVGAAFKYNAGLLPRAPRWMQDCGLEWLFRLSREPLRVWQRQIYAPAYIVVALLQLAGVRFPLRHVDPASLAECRFG